MKIKFKNTPDQIELVKAMGSRDTNVSREAMEVFAAFIGPVIQKVINNVGSASLIYHDLSYNEDDSPTIPLDLFADEGTGYITTWSQSIAGGLPTSMVEGVKEMRVSTYRLDSAIAFMKKYARKSRLDVVAKGVERMAQEILLKQERNAWAVVLKALAEGQTNGMRHVIQSATADVFLIGDMSRLITNIRRMNTTWSGGTTSNGYSEGITDLFVSPEIKGQIRGFAFNAMNTQGAGGAALGNDARSGGIALPDAVREKIFRNIGASEIFGVSIHDLLELGAGTNRKYNALFGEFAGSTQYDGAAFVAADDEILVGFDLTKEAFIRTIATNADSGASFTTQADDQWVTRSEKLGFYGSLEEGRVCIDCRAVGGIIV